MPQVNLCIGSYAYLDFKLGGGHQAGVRNRAADALWPLPTQGRDISDRKDVLPVVTLVPEGKEKHR